MKNLLFRYRLGILVLIWGALCAKFLNAKWYDASSKLSVFASSNSNQNNYY